MRISTITNFAYGATLLLTGVSAIAFVTSASAILEERVAVQQRAELDDLGDDLAISAEKRSDEARLYTMRGNERHLRAFRHEEQVAKTRERTLARLRQRELTPAEMLALDEAEQNIGELDVIEGAALVQAERGAQPAAAKILFGPDHERAQKGVIEPIVRFRSLVNVRTGAEVQAAKIKSDRYADIARTMLGLTAALFLGVLYFVLRRRVSMPLSRLTGIVMRLARQDYSVEVPPDRRRDEIGEMSQAIGIFRDNGLERERLEAERAAEQRIKDAILQMMHRLQATNSQDELAEVVTCFSPQTFPDLPGHLYVLDQHRQNLVLAGSWLDPVNQTVSLPASACWGLRRGRPHLSGRDDIACPHVEHVERSSLCVPLTAQGDAIGLLYFEAPDDAEATVESARLYMELMAENIGLALANLRLRERLTNLAARDPLTGLLNRRSLDDALNQRAREAHPGPCSCLMIDIDHFKRFNDEFGHDAGDMVMQHVAGMMTAAVGDAGGTFRFGGEEFTILLPDADEEASAALAEQLRKQIRAAALAFRGHILGHITVSIGVAATPAGGIAFASLVASADAALLAAKSHGRDQVMTASRLQHEDAQDGRAA
ncbi:diguanylate cyclase [Rhizorhabdus argentea]|uniref:diguanylate cyclase n=1 Tax=Rhizorhabdus argentea TaxID=1387174 RepID=UPI0030EE3D69